MGVNHPYVLTKDVFGGGGRSQKDNGIREVILRGAGQIM